MHIIPRNLTSYNPGYLRCSVAIKSNPLVSKQDKKNKKKKEKRKKEGSGGHTNMSNPIRSRVLKRFQSLLNTIPLHLNQPTTNHKPCPIKPIVTVNANLGFFDALLSGRLQAASNKGDEPCYVLFRGRNFGGGGEFMVGYGRAEEGCGIVCHPCTMRDVDDVPDIRVLPDQMVGGMSSVVLAESLTVNSMDVSNPNTFMALRGDVPTSSETLWILNHYQSEPIKVRHVPFVHS